MRSSRPFLALPIAVAILVAACGGAPITAAPSGSAAMDRSPTVSPSAAVDPVWQSDGGGEPRSTGYWLLWNTCAAANQSETARANGGRAAGWILVDDLLADPGISIGGVAIDSCEAAVRVLVPQTGVALPTPLERLRAAVLTAELNRAAGAEGCPGGDETLDLAQDILGAAAASGREPSAELLDELLSTVGEYNAGSLCR